VEIVELRKAKTPKERLVNQLTQEVGGLASYWNKIPAEQLRALYDAIKDDDAAKAGLASLVKQLQDAKQTNSQLNQKNFGLTQTTSKLERIATQLTHMNAALEEQKNELLKKIQAMVGVLTDVERSEIRQAVRAIQKHISLWIR
jgi:DNA repair ATPase RecN